MQGERQHLVSISVSHYHLLHNLLNVLVGRFNSAIHLWTIRRRVVMLDLERLTKLLHQLVIEIRSIVSNDLLRNPITTDYVVLDKASNHLFGNIRIRCGFNPLGEVINGNQNEAMSIRSSRLNLSNHVNAPHCKRPRRSQDIQRHRRHVHFIGIDLALVTNSDMVMTISFHSGPIITSPQDLLSHCMPTRMGTKLTFVHFLYDFRSFFLHNTSEQHTVKMPLVQHPTVEVKLRCKPSQKLLISHRRFGRILLSFEELFDIMIPGITIQFNISLKAKRRLIQPVDGNVRRLIGPLHFEHGSQSSESISKIVFFSRNMLECDLIKVRVESHHMLSVRNQILMASFPISIDLANDKIGIPINFQVLDSQIDRSFDTIYTSFIFSHVISAIKTDSGCKRNMKT